MKALVLFDTLFGNTERIAGCLAEGLCEAGVQAECARVRDTEVERLAEYDLVALGAPTQYFTASKHMKEFLEQLKDVDLKGVRGFAFDTKLGSPLSGSAAKFIEKELRGARVEIVRPRRSATVTVQKDKTALKPGMEELFRLLGREIGAVVGEMPKKAGGARNGNQPEGH